MSAFAQVPCVVTSLGTQLTLADDAFSAALPLGFSFDYGGVTYTDVQVCSNGYVVFGTVVPAAADYTPTVTELLGDPDPRVCPIWRDLNPSATGSGQVYYSAVASTPSTPAYFAVTWDGVYQFGTSTPITAQVVFIEGGAMQFYHAADVVNGGNAWVLGASPGNGALANPVTFSTLPIATTGNATLHEDGSSGFAVSDHTMLWTPDGAGGYVVSPIAGCASSETYGSGCVSEFSTYYEYFLPSTTFDLSNQSFSGIPTGVGYIVTTGLAQYLAPSPSATNMGLADDAVAPINLTQPFVYPGGQTNVLEVCSNGFVGPFNNAASYQPDPATALTWQGPVWLMWHDFIPTGGANGDVFYEEVNGIVYITWLNVVSYVGTSAGTTTSTFQWQFDTNSGFWHLVFESMDNVSVSTWLNGDGYIVGYTPGNGAGDPGSMDLTPVATGQTQLTVGAADTFPLTLDIDASPQINTTPNFVVGNITATAPVGGLLYGITRIQPGIDLTSFGMPGCFQYNDQLAATLFFPNGATSVALPFPIPNIVATLQVQAAVFDPVSASTPLGGLSSNGLEVATGN